MAKVESLIKIASYLKENPDATIPEISSATGISEAYIKECKRDVDELSIHIWKLLLEKHQVDFLMSRLNSSNEFERRILHKLRQVYPEEKDGAMRIASPEDAPTSDYLYIGICAPKGNRAHIEFWLRHLLYDELLNIDSKGSIEYRLATEYEEVEGYYKWRIKLRDDLLWSDGKPVTCEDVAHSIRGSSSAPIVQEIKEINKREMLFYLAQGDAFFPYRLSSTPILPSHSPIYEVTNGPFRFKKSKPSANTFHLYGNRDYYRKGHPKIDSIILKTFERSPFAIKAVVDKKLDLFFPLSLHETCQYSSAPTQSFFFNDLTYWVLLVNKESDYLKHKGRIQRLKESIDYDSINSYLSGRMPKTTIHTSRSGTGLDIRIGYIIYMPTLEAEKTFAFISDFLGGANQKAVNITGHSSETVRKTVDVILTWAYFGSGYSRLRRCFHSKGVDNILGIQDTEVDFLTEKLDTTSDMDERTILGQAILERLKQENAIILLAPHLEYIFSNLHIEPSSRLSSVTDFILNLSNIFVNRGGGAEKSLGSRKLRTPKYR